MKRRRFLKSTTIPVAAIAPSGAYSSSLLFGQPSSLLSTDAAADRALVGAENAAKYALSKLDIPFEFWEQLTQSCMIWQELGNSQLLRKEFCSDPYGFLSRYGYSVDDFVAQQNRIELMRIAFSEETYSLLASADYDGFINQLARSGVLKKHNSSSLDEQINNRLKENAATLEALVNAGIDQAKKDLDSSPIFQLLSSDNPDIDKLEELASTVTVAVAVTDIVAATNVIAVTSVEVVGNQYCKSFSPDSLFGSLKNGIDVALISGDNGFSKFLEDKYRSISAEVEKTVSSNIKRLANAQRIELTDLEASHLSEIFSRIAVRGIV